MNECTEIMLYYFALRLNIIPSRIHFFLFILRIIHVVQGVENGRDLENEVLNNTYDPPSYEEATQMTISSDKCQPLSNDFKI